MKKLDFNCLKWLLLKFWLLLFISLLANHTNKLL